VALPQLGFDERRAGDVDLQRQAPAVQLRGHLLRRGQIGKGLDEGGHAASPAERVATERRRERSVEAAQRAVGARRRLAGRGIGARGDGEGDGDEHAADAETHDRDTLRRRARFLDGRRLAASCCQRGLRSQRRLPLAQKESWSFGERTPQRARHTCANS